MDMLLNISDLRVAFVSEVGLLEAVRAVSLRVRPGEAVGLVGESGSGKSVTALAIMRLLAPSAGVTGGSIAFNGTDLLRLSENEMRAVRGRQISMVFQDPLTSLNPAFTIGQQLVDAITAHSSVSRRNAWAQAAEALSNVGIDMPERRLGSYPHQFSGGMRQRVAIAMAIACRPQLLIADEPTTALDVTVQAGVVGLLKRLRKELGLAILFISHNLDLVAEICDRVVVMYAGAIMEEAPVEQLFSTPKHPYTRLLQRCIPRLGSREGLLQSIDGSPPILGPTAVGCPFQPRCPLAVERCGRERPPEKVMGEHCVTCWEAS